MDKRKARQIGIRQTLKATTFAVLLGEFALFLQTTAGDWANGLLFFLQDQVSPVIIIAILFLFLPSLLFGGRAGVEVILRGRKPVWIALKYALIALTGIFLIMFYTFRSYNLSRENTNRLLLSGFSPMAVAIFGIWFFATWRMKVLSRKL